MAPPFSFTSISFRQKPSRQTPLHYAGTYLLHFQRCHLHTWPQSYWTPFEQCLKREQKTATVTKPTATQIPSTDQHLRVRSQLQLTVLPTSTANTYSHKQPHRGISIHLPHSPYGLLHKMNFVLVIDHAGGTMLNLLTFISTSPALGDSTYHLPSGK